MKRGRIKHALRITVPRTRQAFIYPARHFASSLTDPSLPAMGQRVRLKRSFSLRGYPRQSRVVLRALKEYGAFVADNGSAWYVSGAPSRGWNNDDLHSFGPRARQRLRGGGHLEAEAPAAVTVQHVTLELRRADVDACVAFYELLGFDARRAAARRWPTGRPGCRPAPRRST